MYHPSPGLIDLFQSILEADLSILEFAENFENYFISFKLLKTNLLIQK